MLSLFPYAKEALENTYKIANRCNVSIDFGEYKLPVYPVPAPYTADEYLSMLCYKDWLKDIRYFELRQRLEYEMDTIKSMGFRLFLDSMGFY